MNLIQIVAGNKRHNLYVARVPCRGELVSFPSDHVMPEVREVLQVEHCTFDADLEHHQQPCKEVVAFVIVR